jgi:PIN domain nuclease of toxin-antitoxin system
VKYLLDTCALLWLAEGNRRLSETARTAIADPGNSGYISAVSLWEISMKSVVRKLSVMASTEVLADRAREDGIFVLPLVVAHVAAFNRLPATHRDPFDRLLAAVAMEELCSFISPESGLDYLGVTRLW